MNTKVIFAVIAGGIAALIAYMLLRGTTALGRMFASGDGFDANSGMDLVPVDRTAMLGLTSPLGIDGYCPSGGCSGMLRAQYDVTFGSHSIAAPPTPVVYTGKPACARKVGDKYYYYDANGVQLPGYSLYLAQGFPQC